MLPIPVATLLELPNPTAAAASRRPLTSVESCPRCEENQDDSNSTALRTCWSTTFSAFSISKKLKERLHQLPDETLPFGVCALLVFLRGSLIATASEKGTIVRVHARSPMTRVFGAWCQGTFTGHWSILIGHVVIRCIFSTVTCSNSTNDFKAVLEYYNVIGVLHALVRPQSFRCCH